MQGKKWLFNNRLCNSLSLAKGFNDNIRKQFQVEPANYNIYVVFRLVFITTSLFVRCESYPNMVLYLSEKLNKNKIRS